MPWIWLVVLCAVVLLMVARSHGGEPERKGTIWLYTDPDHCPPCRKLDKDIEAGKLAGFTIKRLKVPAGYQKPCIYYRDAKGKWAHHMGWGPRDPQQFLEEWREATKR